MRKLLCNAEETDTFFLLNMAFLVSLLIKQEKKKLKEKCKLNEKNLFSNKNVCR